MAYRIPPLNAFPSYAHSFTYSISRLQLSLKHIIGVGQKKTFFFLSLSLSFKYNNIFHCIHNIHYSFIHVYNPFSAVYLYFLLQVIPMNIYDLQQCQLEKAYDMV